MTVSYASTSRVVVRASVWSGASKRSSSSIANAIRSGSRRSSARWSGKRSRWNSEFEISPWVVVMPAMNRSTQMPSSSSSLRRCSRWAATIRLRRSSRGADRRSAAAIRMYACMASRAARALAGNACWPGSRVSILPNRSVRWG